VEAVAGRPAIADGIDWLEAVTWGCTSPGCVTPESPWYSLRAYWLDVGGKELGCATETGTV